ncbi:hypothetical protein KJ885_01855 [Patescibacteria group bacterium]|nr:hypothetical protein [Patescibacteria group bacterium]
MTTPQQKDTNKNRLYGAISYLWILCFIPLLFKRDSSFALYHARQGLVLLIAEFFATLIGWIPFVGYYVSMFLGIILAILALLGIINALDGKHWKMPVLGDFAQKIRI